MTSNRERAEEIVRDLYRDQAFGQTAWIGAVAEALDAAEERGRESGIREALDLADEYTVYTARQQLLGIKWPE